MIHTNKHLAYVLGSSEKELFYIIENIDSYYRYKREPKTKYGLSQLDRKHRTKMRELCVSNYPLKRIQKRIHLLLKQIDLPSYVYGSVQGSNNILNAKQHINGKYFLSIDLKNFFPNIGHQQVFKMLCQNGFSPTVAKTLTELTTYQGSLPQGTPSSPVISNLAFVETGNILFHTAKHQEITFTTYVDDLIFSSKNDFKEVIPTFLQTIRSQGFFPNHKKISYKVGKAEITGAIVYGNKLWPIPLMKEMAANHPNRTTYVHSILAHNLC